MKRWMRYTILMCKYPKVQPTKVLQLHDEYPSSLTSVDVQHTYIMYRLSVVPINIYS